MSRAHKIEIKPSIYQKMKNIAAMIKKAGLPALPDIAPVLKSELQVIPLDRPAPLSLTEGLAMCGMFPLSDPLVTKSLAKSSNRAKVEVTGKEVLQHVMKDKKPVPADTIGNRSATMSSMIEQKSEPVEDGDVKIADMVIASLQQLNLEAKAEEHIIPGITKITVEDILKQNRTRIPEYAFVRRT